MITVRAHAKINLNLRILGRRPDDGYHDLRTVFQALALHDTLTFVPTPGPFVLESTEPGLPTDGRNLICRAADVLWRHLGREGCARDVLARVEKRIPMKGGLGGGSADAAAALLGLARIWGANVPASELRVLASRLGADVGFFLNGGAALGTGRGDELCPLEDLPRLGVLLVVPGFDVSTADAYRWVDEARGWGQGGQVGQVGRVGQVGQVGQTIPGCAWPKPLDEVVNDFEPVVARRHPELDEVRRAILAAGADAAAMTGSGSTVFGLFTDDSRLFTAAGRLAGVGQAIVTHTLGRQEYLDRAAACEGDRLRRG